MRWVVRLVSARRVLRLLALVRVVRAAVCPLCAALVVLDGESRHRAWHVATVRRSDGGPARSV